MNNYRTGQASIEDLTEGLSTTERVEEDFRLVNVKTTSLGKNQVTLWASGAEMISYSAQFESSNADYG